MTIQIFDPSLGGVGGGGGGGGLVEFAPVATTSGTTHDLLNIPDDAVYVAVLVDQVQVNSANRLVLKLGISTGFTGQPAGAEMILDSSNVAANTARTHVVELRRVGTSNEWIATGAYTGQVTLTGRLQRLQLTLNTIGNTDAFSGGQLAGMYSSRKGVGPIASTSNLPEGSNLYWTQGRFDTAFGAKTTDNLTEGTTNLYFTDARAQNAFTASGIISKSGGALSTNVGGLANAMNGILAGGTDISVTQSGSEITVAFTGTAGATSLSGLSDVADVSSAATGTLLVKGTGTDFIATTLSAGSNVSISNTGNGTLTISSSGGGGGGGSSTLAGLDDVTISNMSVGETLVATSSTAMGNGKLGAAGISDGAVTTAKISGLTATSSGFLQADGDGTMSIGTPSGGGSGGAQLSDFDAISDSTIIDKDNDGVLMYDGDALARMDLERFEETVEPLELKTLTLTGYTFQNRSLPTGAGAWTISTIASTKYAIFNGKNADETRKLSRIATPSFKVRVQGSNASRWFEFVVTQAAATQGGSILGVISDDFIDSSAANQGVPFSNDESCTITSNGRHVSYGDLEHTIDTSRRTQGVSAYGVGQYVQGLKATERDVEVGTNDAKWVSPKQLADSLLTLEDPTTWSGFTYSESGVSSGTLNSIGEDSNVDYLFQIVTTQAIAQNMDSKFKRGELITFRRDASNVTTSRVEYADARAAPSGGNWLFEVKINEDSATSSTRPATSPGRERSP